MTLSDLIREYKRLKDAGELTSGDNGKRVMVPLTLYMTQPRTYPINVKFVVRGEDIIINIQHDGVTEYDPAKHIFHINSKQQKQ